MKKVINELKQMIETVHQYYDEYETQYQEEIVDKEEDMIPMLLYIIREEILYT